MSSRGLLHKNALADFVAWAKTKGYVEHPLSRHPYEVARLEYYDPAGSNPHLVFYVRERGEHLTTFGGGLTLARRYLSEREKMPVATVLPFNRRTK